MIDDDLLQRFRALCAYAEQSNAPREWLETTVDALTDFIMSQRIDPRRRRSLAVAVQMANAVKAMCQHDRTHGEAVEALCERYALKRSRVYALLKMSSDITGR